MSISVGDHFVVSWGYDQTNVNFYEVVGVTPSGKSVRILPVGSVTAVDEGPYTHVEPCPGAFRDRDVLGWGNERGELMPLTRKLLPGYNGRPRIKIGRDHSASMVEPGQTFYATGYGYGH